MDNTGRGDAASISSDPTEGGQPRAAESPVVSSAAMRTAGITPEIMAIIEAAVTAFAGKKLRIVSVKLGSTSQAGSSSWGDQGRDMIHRSHNLVQRGH